MRNGIYLNGMNRETRQLESVIRALFETNKHTKKLWHALQKRARNNKEK